MSIQVHKKTPIFLINGEKSSYVFGWDAKFQALRHIYWDKRVSNVKDFEFLPLKELSANESEWDIMMEDYAPWGGRRYKTPCIKATFADGTRDIVFEFLKYEIRDNILTVYLKDRHYNFFITLYYQIIEKLDILSRWVEIENKESNDIIIENLYSAAFHVPEIGMDSTQVKGYWAGEQQLFTERLFPGRKIFESRKGTTSHNHSPYFILSKNATEYEGEVYFGVLAYSGNFKVSIDVSQYDITSVTLGINDFDFTYRLKPGEKFTAPKAYAGYSTEGFSDMSNRMNQFALEYILPKENSGKLRKILYNSWEATEFNISVDQQIKLAKIAAEIGIELFVVDDGWFGGRNSDSAGLGDWYPNKEKFPNSLSELIKKVNDLGMDFGIWVEPEMVSPDSNLYRLHPDWIYNFPNRDPTTARNQLVLNLTRDEVQEYLISALDKLLEENNIAFLKWDMNRPISEPGALNLDRIDQKSLWYRHTQAVFNIVGALRRNHPNVVFEGCSSGGGRVDYGALEHFDQFWTSDNTDALDRLYIQEGYSVMYPIKAMCAWVTDVPNCHTKKTTPLDFRFHCAMMGVLGLGINLLKCSEEELEMIKEKIKEYKEIRHVVQEGKLYRISSLRKSEIHVVQYVLDERESVFFAFLKGQKYISLPYQYTVKMKGLDPAVEYTITGKDSKYKKNGDYLMNVGINIYMIGDYQSQILKIQAK